MDNIIITNTTISRQHTCAISTAEIEKDLLKFGYKGQNQVKDEAVEKARIPYFAVAFYNFIFDNKRIPSPVELEMLYFSQPYFSFHSEGHYVDVNFDGCETKNLSVEGIKARLGRAYPSIVRDFYFYNLCLESGKFENVFYSLREDLLKGNDILVKYAGRIHKVALMINTKRSMNYAYDKQTIRHEVDDRITLAIDRTSAKWCGDYMLYSNADIDNLIEEIKKRT